ncbi:lipopolysaccharide biosynthesis protein [Lachnoclostridium sp. An181]|uniref:lipopolysaccharide biosynthesis protein n=1 Tax=Lachnoclostridium sp. An181 TaxID=1965575 RepID=UPI000B398F75|nr:hypothetical protein [Lachnoclostridium sp. An181]OUP49748.1 hypothetical protein B5F18_06965 [Lachnoclostridium sp. An181]
MKNSKTIKNLSYSVLANGTNTLVSMILVLFVPKILGVTEYSYWQLYLFYSSYVGFFHLGWADGVYLKFGGKKYESLDKTYFNTQFWLLTFCEIILAIIIGGWAYMFVPNTDKQVVFSAFALCCILQIPRTFLQYLLQTTNRIVDYAKNYLLEKIIYAVLVIVLLMIGMREFKVLVGADLIARTVTLILLSLECKDIVFRPIKNALKGFKEAWDNITVGIKLMFANIASNLLLGVVRWAIQNHWSVEIFGRVSLSITASNLLMTFIGAVSIVLYPMLKNISEEKYSEVYIKMRNMLMIPVLGLLVVYYPAKVILSWWLPQYAESLRYMALLFPMCVFESKMTMLINTYLKALRKEKVIMQINWIAVIVTIVTTAISVYIVDNLTLAIVSLPILMGIRSCIGEIILAKEISISIKKDMIVEWILTFIFICTGWFLQSWMTTVIYAFAYIVYLIWKKKDVLMYLEIIKHELLKRRNG